MKSKISYDLTPEQKQRSIDFLQGKLTLKELAETLGTSPHHSYIIFTHTMRKMYEEKKLILK